MSRIIISNQLTEETVEGENALPDDYVQFIGKVAHRLVWLARENDVVVLPSWPDEDFVDYVWRQLGVTGSAPTIVVPPSGRQGNGLLYDDRLRDSAFVAELKKLVEVNGVNEVVPFFFDQSIAWLCRELKLEGAVPGFDFLDQGGNELVNSKSVFRAVAAGNGADIPFGRVVASRQEAEDVIWSLLADEKIVIVKQDFHGGGYGNEILSPVEGTDGFGAAGVTTIANRSALAAHVATMWERYSQGGRRKVVVEHYIQNAVPIYVELTITDQAAELYGYGEMRMKETDRGPTNTGLLIPPPSTSLPAFPGFVESATRIGEAVRGLGYRGNISIDAIVLPTGEILFNEFNGRVGGSTHAHLIAETLVAPDYLDDRVLVVRSRCSWSSVASAVAALDGLGLAYDPATRTGALITGDDGQCIVVAETLDAARAVEDRLVDVLGLVAV
jgi:hypothetical protein